MICRLALFFLVPAAWAADYYVTQSGAGSQTGADLSNAWSMADFNATATPGGGDTVYFNGTLTTTTTIPVSGTDASTRLTLDYTSATLDASTTIDINAKDYLNINGGTFAARSSGTLVSSGSAGEATYVTVQDWSFTGSAGGTAVFFAHWSNDVTFVTIQNNTVDNISDFFAGDGNGSHDITISNNYARTSNNTTTQTDIIFSGDAYNVTLEGNKFIQRAPGANTDSRHNDVIQVYKKGGGGAGNPYGWVVRYNWLENANTTGTGDTSITQMQSMADNGGTPAMKVYGNVIVGTGTAGGNGYSAGGSAGGATIYFYNNTVIKDNNPDQNIRFTDSNVNLHMRNNLGVQDTDIVGGTFVNVTGAVEAADWNYNYFYDDGVTIPPGVTATITGANGSSTTDPLFTDFANNDYTLQSSSPLIDAGDSSLGAEYNQGIAPSATWPNPTLITRDTWDVGAYEHVPSSGTRGSSNPILQTGGLMLP